MPQQRDEIDKIVAAAIKEAAALALSVEDARSENRRQASELTFLAGKAAGAEARLREISNMLEERCQL